MVTLRAISENYTSETSISFPLYYQDRHIEAEKYFALAQSIRETVLGHRDAKLALTLDSRALTLQHLVRPC